MNKKHLIKVVISIIVLGIIGVITAVFLRPPTAQELSMTMVVETSSAWTVTPDRTKIAEATYEAETAEAQVIETAASNQTATNIVRETSTANYVLTQEHIALETVQAHETQVAEPFFGQIQKLYDDGYISDKSGYYISLPDFENNFAGESGVTQTQDRYFTRTFTYIEWNNYSTGYSARNLVLKADITWENYSDTSLRMGGCGFFLSGNGNSDLVWISALGIHYISNGAIAGNKSVGRLGFPEGNATLMITVEYSELNVFVNGEHLDTRKDIYSGKANLLLAIIAGDSRGFGTRCTMENIELWILAD